MTTAAATPPLSGRANPYYRTCGPRFTHKLASTGLHCHGNLRRGSSGLKMNSWVRESSGPHSQRRARVATVELLSGVCQGKLVASVRGFTGLISRCTSVVMITNSVAMLYVSQGPGG